MVTTATRVAERFAREFSSPEALKEYLKEHPEADPKKHTVRKKDKGLKDVAVEKVKQDIGALKNLSKSALGWLKKAPTSVQKFVSDPEARKTTLKAAQSSLKEGAKNYAKQLAEVAKKTGEDYKTAGGAVQDVLQGKKLSSDQKKAVRNVAIQMGILAAGAALAGSGGLSGAAYMAKGLAKYVAQKAAKNVLGDIYALKNVGKLGGGVMDLFEKFGAEKKDHEKALAALVLAKVHEELAKIDDEGIAEALEEASKMQKEASIAERFAVDVAPETLLATLDSVIRLHSRLQGWIRRAPRVLADAKRNAKGLPDGWVWQDPFVRYWEGFETYESDLQDLDSKLDDVYLNVDFLSDVANQARDATNLPRKGQIEYVLNSFKFFPNPDGRGDHIAYQVKAIEEWASAFEKWSNDSVRLLKTLSGKAQRRIRRRTP